MHVRSARFRCRQSNEMNYAPFMRGFSPPATLAKARDGEEGPISAFQLQFVHIGFDEDDEPFGSCAVAPSDAPAPAKKSTRPKLNKGGKIALAALQEAVTECGEVPPASNHIPSGVKAVKMETWRTYAAKAGITSSDEADALRKAFGRAHEALVADRHVGVWAPWAWVA